MAACVSSGDRRSGQISQVPVLEYHVTLALASLAVASTAWSRMRRLGVGLRQPAGVLAPSEPLQHHQTS
jgi:hypothetical protein